MGLWLGEKYIKKKKSGFNRVTRVTGQPDESIRFFEFFLIPVLSKLVQPLD
jgi:hypothetical protein